jgi:aryl-alcohol dehydrogenase-like predicted oxidoreductase
MPEDSKKIDSLTTYYLLGRGGLRVSPLCLGTMTFGTEWGWGSPAETARRIFDRYLEAGGNFIDTADGYTNGKSEELVGQFLKEGGRRDRVVLATKFSFNAFPGDPNAGGNGRKNIYRALEGSLRRLQTDYVDLYWLHAWDGLTPVEEVISTLDDLVGEGKVRAIGFSDTPAWYMARAQTIAEQQGRCRIAATQLEYSAAERNIEREHIPAAMDLGIALLPWSPLAAGFLSGKYKRQADGIGTGEGRLETTKVTNPSNTARRFNEHNWRVVEAVAAVAKELERSPAQVALNWVAKRPGVVSTIIGATKLDQLEDNLRCLEFEIPAPLRQKIDEVGAPPVVFPYTFFQQQGRMMLSGGTQVAAEPPWFRPR